MSIILTLEQKVVEDIVHVLKRLPFQPHFLIELEAQLEAQLASPVQAPVEAPAEAPVETPPAS
jgi:hypothetical protein